MLQLKLHKYTVAFCIECAVGPFCFGIIFLILNQKGTTAFYDFFKLNAIVSK